jgi:hypothetical protein
MEGQTMLRALSLALLTAVSAPAFATEPTDAEVLAQQQQNTAPQSAPRRDCERSQEGIS